jgi:excinuclease ABC subunit C
MFSIDEELKKLPDLPGVYMHKDSLGTIIYVGKAVSLRSRVRQYFQKSYQNNPKIKSLAENIYEFDYIVCSTEIEALVLECNLIKKYRPKYNVLMKDDKTYPYIKVTMKEEYPRVIKTRNVIRDGSKYFGPYIDAGSVNKVVDYLNEIYPLKKCRSLKFGSNHRPCLNNHIGTCMASCVNPNIKEEYDKYIEDIVEFLNGKNSKLVDSLKQKIRYYSDNLEYERAAKYRDYLNGIKALKETQRVTMKLDRDMDIIIPLRSIENTAVALFKVRDGKLSGREIIDVDDEMQVSDDELIYSFIEQYYSKWSFMPPELILEKEVKERAILEEYLSSYGRKIKITVPKKGSKKALLDMVITDSYHIMESMDERVKAAEFKKEELRKELIDVIKKTGVKSDKYNKVLRVEAYDISNTNGVYSVGAMVVYEGFDPVKKDYRKFRIKTIEGPNDYGSLQELLYRRFKRALSKDKGFDNIPDLIFMDGGLGQVNAALKVLKALDINIPVLGLAKDDKHRTRAIVFEDGTELDLKDNPILLKYAGKVQEEVHRFAITYHRGLRGKSVNKSILDEIDGVGAHRKNAMLNHFKSIDGIKNATYTQLMEVEGMTSRVAENVINYFKGK